MLRKALALVTLSVFLVQVLFSDLAQAQEKIKDFKPPTFEEIYQGYSFGETADLSETVKYDPKELEKEQKKLDERKKTEKETVKKEQAQAKKQHKEYQNQLKAVANDLEKLEWKYRSEETVIQDGKPRKVPKIDYDGFHQDPAYQALQEKRKNLECQVKEWEIKSNEVVYKSKLENIKTFYEMLGAKLDTLRDWPSERQKIDAEIASSQSANRLFANPENIGMRDLGFGNQGEDVKYLQHPEIKAYLEEFEKKSIKDPKIRAYMIGLIRTIVQNSDLKIPLEDKMIFILDDEDVNAFAMVGGIMGINRGLLLKVESEAQLAGVLAHEIGHLAARHGHRIMTKANIRGIIAQAVQVALMFTGIGYLAYYGIMNLMGLLINLELLGVTRAYELEADVLGMQYLWKAGYYPDSFMEFFEILAKDAGYVRKTSFFRTHPASSERISNARREKHFFSPKENYLSNTTTFLEMKARLCVAMEAEKAEEKELQNRQYRPTLTRGQQKEDERLKKDCGLQKPADSTGPSPCDDPQLEDYKYKIREELSKEKKDKEQSEEEKNRPSLKRPNPPNN